jgi:hypothetical protein
MFKSRWSERRFATLYDAGTVFWDTHHTGPVNVNVNTRNYTVINMVPPGAGVRDNDDLSS